LHHNMKQRSTRTIRALLAAAIAAAPAAGFAQSGLTVSATAANVVTSAGASNLLIDTAFSISGAGTVTQATVTISAGYQSGDVLSCDNAAKPGGVTGSFNSATGVLTFSGSATPADYQSLLRTVSISLSNASATTRSITFTLGDLVSYTNGHYYKFVSTTASWTAAKAAAAASGNTYYGLTGYLATVTSAGENAFIKQTLSADGWIGASDEYTEINAAAGTSHTQQSNTEGNWYWVTGPEAGTQFTSSNAPNPGSVSGRYMNWTSGEPNNSSNSEHYAEIYASATNPGLWNDLGSAQTLGYVVEYGGLSGDPAVQLSATRNVQVMATTIDGTYNYNPTTYHTNGGAVVVDGSVSVSSIGNVTDARVTISSGFNSGDVLGYNSSLLSGMTASYNNGTGVLSFTGTVTPAQLQALFRTVTFSATAAPNVNREITFSLGGQVANSNGHFYKYVTAANISWSSAKTAAAGQSYLGYTGYLATITSAAENTFITQKLASNGWIGASDAVSEINSATGTTTYADQTAAEGHWYWITGPEAGTNFSNGNASPLLVSGQFMNWNTGEPNNSSGENYAQIFASGSIGTWNDLNGSSQGGYVVEFGGLPSDPMITLSSTSRIVVGSPLPIDGISLDASAEGTQVKLRWNTLNEQGTHHFDVERSADGASFSSIGTQRAVGQGFNHYAFTDEAPFSGLGYYRIKAIDADGSSVFSGIRLVKFGKQQVAAQLAPNPASGTLMLNRGSNEPATIICMDATGRSIFRLLSVSASEQIDISRLAPGAYLLRIEEAGSRSTLRFIKE
jgi:hypothetical protein